MISFPLAKLSFAHDAYVHEQTFQWNHKTDNLVCVIDSYQAGGSNFQLLKVVQDTQIREQIELERLILESQDLTRDMQQRGIELKGEQLPISAIVRCPLLAIRWQLPDQKIRRIQIRFKSDEDYNIVYNRLHRLGLRMMPPQNQSRDRGPTKISKVTNTALQLPVVPSQPYDDRTGPSCPPSRLAEISSRPSTAVSAPAAPRAQSLEVESVRPSTAFATTTTFPSSSPLKPPIYFARPESPSDAIFPPSNRSVLSGEHEDTPPSSPQSTLLYERPNTADLPPRRELPFSRDSLPTSSSSETYRSPSRPPTALMGPPPLPSRVSDLRPGSGRASSIDSELPPLRQPTIVGEFRRPFPGNPRPSSPLSPLAPHSKPMQVTATYEDQNSSSQSSPSPQAPPASRTTHRPGARPLTPVSNELLNQDVPASPSMYSAPSFGVKDHSSHLLDSHSSGDAERDLKTYAMQSSDNRRAALDNFILNSLDSEEFLTLVEDMETNWARIGLGTW